MRFKPVQTLLPLLVVLCTGAQADSDCKLNGKTVFVNQNGGTGRIDFTIATPKTSGSIAGTVSRPGYYGEFTNDRPGRWRASQLVRYCGLLRINVVFA